MAHYTTKSPSVNSLQLNTHPSVFISSISIPVPLPRAYATQIRAITVRSVCSRIIYPPLLQPSNLSRDAIENPRFCPAFSANNRKNIAFYLKSATVNESDRFRWS
ncbi:hypothetical protein L596_012277 [Steinernema carpocapsae]|uniref:Uncharacterized protein n=1 Tax=Steinernema carpocapsae TaxID=34508 RepID=A0A4U5NXF5_STECR|nr:hypothetical protein L596_012277 [Steinernema carpocapsae]